MLASSVVSSFPPLFDHSFPQQVPVWDKGATHRVHTHQQDTHRVHTHKQDTHRVEQENLQVRL